METRGERIKMLREAKGWTQTDLANRLNAALAAVGEAPINRAAVSQWETGGTTDMKNVTFLFLVELLGTTDRYLLFGADQRARDNAGRFGKRGGHNGSKV